MRIAFDHRAVHERAGIAFVGVADQVLLLAGGLRGRTSTSCRWESRRRRGRAARSARPCRKPRSGVCFRKALAKRLVAAAGDVFVDLRRIDDAAVGQHPAGLRAKNGCSSRKGTSAQGSRPSPRCWPRASSSGIVPAQNRLQQAAATFSASRLNDHAGAAGKLHFDERLGRAQPDAADLDHVGVGFRDSSRNAGRRPACRAPRRRGRRCRRRRRSPGASAVRAASSAETLWRELVGPLVCAPRGNRFGSSDIQVLSVVSGRRLLDAGVGLVAMQAYGCRHWFPAFLAVGVEDLATFCVVTPAWNSPLTQMTGARPQAPMQATTSRLNSPSRRGLAGLDLQFAADRVQDRRRAFHVAGRAAAHLDVVLPCGWKRNWL